MHSAKPYLLRAMYEWIADNGCTPYILVRVDGQTTVPLTYVRNGEIVFNISRSAVRGLSMGDDGLKFSARFSGVPFDVDLPLSSIVRIFTREHGTGLSFDYPDMQEIFRACLDSVSVDQAAPTTTETPFSPPGKKIKLRLVK